MSFQIKKDKTKWIIGATGNGWELIPKHSEKIIIVLNDYVKIEKYGVQPDYLCMMDMLNEKPSIVSGQDNLGEMIARINNMRVPFVAPYKYEEIPLSEPFPLKEVVEKYGSTMFTNSICYMIAFALLNGAKEIDIYGVNQAGSYEYTAERGGVEHWVGLAMGLGVVVIIYGEQSQVLKHQGRYGKNIMYGYGSHYEDIIRYNEQFGQPIVKKLLLPPKNVARQFRTFKTR